MPQWSHLNGNDNPLHACMFLRWCNNTATVDSYDCATCWFTFWMNFMTTHNHPSPRQGACRHWSLFGMGGCLVTQHIRKGCIHIFPNPPCVPDVPDTQVEPKQVHSCFCLLASPAEQDLIWPFTWNPVRQLSYLPSVDQLRQRLCVCVCVWRLSSGFLQGSKSCRGFFFIPVPITFTFKFTFFFIYLTLVSPDWKLRAARRPLSYQR